MALQAFDFSRRRPGDFLLIAVTLVELPILLLLTPTFTVTDWIYVCQHLLVLGIALTRPAPAILDRSAAAGVAIAVAYGYTYAQVIFLRFVPGAELSPRAGFVLVVAAAALSLLSLIALGRRFGILPALRGVATKGPYAVVRHPMYLSYIVGDIGYNLQEWNGGTILIVMAGWAALIYRIYAEERILAHDAAWPKYAATVRYRLLPGIW